MNARREAILKGEAAAPSSQTPAALHVAGGQGRSRPLSVVSGYRQTARGVALTWLLGLGFALLMLVLGGYLFSLLLQVLQGDASALDGLRRKAAAVVYISPLMILAAPLALITIARPLLRARGEDVVLRLDAKGFHDKRSGRGFIPWTAVRKLRNRRAHIEVKLRWRDLPKEERPGFLGRLLPLKVWSLPLEVSNRDLLQEMTSRWRAAL